MNMKTAIDDILILLGDTGINYYKDERDTRLKNGLRWLPVFYKENGLYKNLDIIAADFDALAAINKPRLFDSGELTNFTGN